MSIEIFDNPAPYAAPVISIILLKKTSPDRFNQRGCVFHAFQNQSELCLVIPAFSIRIILDSKGSALYTFITVTGKVGTYY